jgi:peptide-methionine (R)-S-oxide reductase
LHGSNQFVNKRVFLKNIFTVVLLINFLKTKITLAKEKMTKSKEEWKKILSETEYDVLKNEGTERAYTSALNEEKREGNYYCVGCNSKLFSSKMKFDSGTGWPSFFESYSGAFETSTDFKLVYPRTEYHCAKCDGHHGHLFDDGPEPTGKRYCNNGIVLKFIPEKIS